MEKDPDIKHVKILIEFPWTNMKHGITAHTYTLKPGVPGMVETQRAHGTR